METVWIIGAGRFGRLAVKRLKKNFHLVIVDIDINRLNAIRGSNVTLEQGNGIDYLTDNLSQKTMVDWIIPTLPVHLAWEWSQKKIGTHSFTTQMIPDEIDSLLPHPVRGSQSQIYVTMLILSVRTTALSLTIYALIQKNLEKKICTCYLNPYFLKDTSPWW